MEANGKKVLIVDEQPNYIVGLKKGLTENGFEVYHAGDGDSAIQLITEIQPDIILSEVSLPQLDGLGLLQAIRRDEKFRQIPFILISNQKKVDDRIKSILLGADDYVQKPYFVEEVIARVELILHEIECTQNPTRLGSFSGKLSEMNLIDLIQTLEVGKKSGILTLKRNGKQGRVQIQSGNVINAQFENFSGEDALERMFTWTEGGFQVMLTDINMPRKVKLDNQQLVEHGREKVSQWERLKTELPPLNAVLAPFDPAILSGAEVLTDDEMQVLALVDGKNSILEIVEQIPWDEVQTLRTIRELFHKDLLQVQEMKPGDNATGQKKNSEYIRNIKQFVNRHRDVNSKEISLIRSFFVQPALPVKIQPPSFEDVSNTLAGQPFPEFDYSAPGTDAYNKQQSRIRLTKSELMMIREKLM